MQCALLVVRRFMCLAVISLAWSCGGDEEAPPTLEELNFRFDYNSAFSNRFYPSAILAINEAEAIKTGNPDFFTFTVTSPSDDATVRVVMDESPFFSASETSKSIAVEGETYTFSFDINWKYDAILAMEEETISFNYRLLVNDMEMLADAVTLPNATLNQFVYGVNPETGRGKQMHYMLAAYINENNELLDDIIDESVAQAPFVDIYGTQVTSFDGYDGDDRYQIQALWYTLQERGITFSPQAFNSRLEDPLYVHSLKFLSQVIEDNSGNAMDACVLFSSLLMKVGLDPIVITVPTGIYFGVYSSPTHDGRYYFDPTTIGRVDLRELTIGGDGKFTSETVDSLSDYVEDGLLRQEALDDYLNGLVDELFIKSEISRMSMTDGHLFATEQSIDNYTITEGKENPLIWLHDIALLRQTVNSFGL